MTHDLMLIAASADPDYYLVLDDGATTVTCAPGEVDPDSPLIVGTVGSVRDSVCAMHRTRLNAAAAHTREDALR